MWINDNLQRQIWRHEDVLGVVECNHVFGDWILKGLVEYYLNRQLSKI